MYDHGKEGAGNEISFTACLKLSVKYKMAKIKCKSTEKSLNKDMGTCGCKSLL
ncbi:MAG: hypothetical protein KAI50_03425 [Desulfobacterales bacterium]|nr:hypothetical protein [Desulfobacterales bacterium]